MGIWHKEVWSGIAAVVDNPVIVDLYHLWQRLAHQAHALPAHAQLRVEFMARAAGNAMELQVLDNGADYRYTHYGAEIQRHAGFDMTGQRVSDFGGEISDYYLARYRDVLAQRQPLYTVHFSDRAKAVFTWERLICPAIDSDGQTWLLVYNCPLESRHQVLEAVLNATSDGLLALRASRDNQGRLEDWVVLVANPIMVGLLGIQTPTPVGRLISEVVPEWAHSELARKAEEASKRPGGGDFEWQIGAEGQQRVFAGHAGPLADGCVIRLADVTQSKHTERLLQDMAFTDGLTRVPNRRAFDEGLHKELQRAHRLGKPLSMIMMDVDRFKAYNDRYGHLAGDDCLVALAAALRSCIHRPTDLFARYGGEEFACVLPDTPLVDAVELPTRMEQKVRALDLPHADSDVAPMVTISLGVSVTNADGKDDAESLIARADAQLYQAKRSGRGRVVGQTPADAPAGAS